MHPLAPARTMRPSPPLGLLLTLLLLVPALATSASLAGPAGPALACANDGVTCRCSADIDAPPRACALPDPAAPAVCQPGLCAAPLRCDCAGESVCRMRASSARTMCADGGMPPPQGCPCVRRARDRPMFMLAAVADWAETPQPSVECRWPLHFWA